MPLLTDRRHAIFFISNSYIPLVLGALLQNSFQPLRFDACTGSVVLSVSLLVIFQLDILSHVQWPQVCPFRVGDIFLTPLVDWAECISFCHAMYH